MSAIHIMTPVKDSIDLTLECIKAVSESNITVPFKYTIYNDFSSDETKQKLVEAASTHNFELINLEELTQKPSPNYLLILQIAQREAIKDGAVILIVESDVVVQNNTIQEMYDEVVKRQDCGMAAAVTVDRHGDVNYPYTYAKGREKSVYKEKKHLSFCCTLLSNSLLHAIDFNTLDEEKKWHDVTISQSSLKKGFTNYLFINLPVLHNPHGSRPWKHLKYKNPIKYYWRKYTQGLDKI